jgi:hypothetical protein
LTTVKRSVASGPIANGFALVPQAFAPDPSDAALMAATATETSLDAAESARPTPSWYVAVATLVISSPAVGDAAAGGTAEQTPQNIATAAIANERKFIGVRLRGPTTFRP